MAGRTALVVIDVKLGMFDAPAGPPGSGLRASSGKKGGLIGEPREAVSPVICAQHRDGPGGLLEDSSERWEVRPRIAPISGDPIVRERTPDSFSDKTLRGELGSRKIEGVVIAEMQTKYCVDTTCRRAFSLGYDVTLGRAAHGTSDTDVLSAKQATAHHNGVLGGWFATAVNADEVRFGGRVAR
jgi:nicotinamidase-related amidase